MRYFILFMSMVIFSMISCEKEQENVSDSLNWEYGKNEYNLEIDGEVRNFLIHVPERYSDEEEVALVLMLHGSTGTGTKFYNISRWVEKADEQGFIAVFPTALAYPIIGKNGTSTKWSSDGLDEQVVEGTVIKDDIPFIEELVKLVKNSFKINSQRVYISGFSNGGGFVKSEVIPRMSHVFAAASTGGGVGHRQPFTIEGSYKMPLFNITGTADENLLPLLVNGATALPIQAKELENQSIIWQSIKNSLEGLCLRDSYEETPDPPIGNTITFANSEFGDDNELVLFLVKDMGHNYPNENNNRHKVVAADVLWTWFNKWELNN
ncbi:alpha/beta hydrolase family esterase [Portibacter marinus]|uniref:alpha/beta hydrolase family esterase n=1 Tax=Portibacter marinus TaxID=2898660 RepID=UPI001EEC501A|nr:PHB depolymerase family esterase [Portibacter marinus]